MSILKSIFPDGLKYNHIIGTGGIGSGIFFSLRGSHTLGRNESRMATLEPYSDFCKQHIIMHYIAVLLTGQSTDNFKLFPIGKVGNDETGKNLLRKMKEAGMDTGNIEICRESVTLFSVCFQYPDRSGGNITTDNSASSHVTPKDISRYFENYHLDGRKGIILSVPEVPVESRVELLKFGRKNSSLNVASLLSSEVTGFSKLGGFHLTDILAINIDEARHIAKIEDDSISAKEVIGLCIEKLVKINSGLTVIITEGAGGSYCYKDNNLESIPALKTTVVSTAGAGDALLAGTITGLCCGLPVHKGYSSLVFSEFPMQTAIELGTLLASVSVTSPDSIHAEVNANLLNEYALERKVEMGPDFKKIFSDCRSEQ